MSLRLQTSAWSVEAGLQLGLTCRLLKTEESRGNRRICRELRAQAPLQFLAHLHDFHPWHHDEFAAQHLVRLVLIRQLARHPAILTILIPAEAPIRYRLRADELKAPQKRIPLRDLKLSSEDRDLHQLFIRTKGFRHDESCSPWLGRCVPAALPHYRTTR